MDLIDEEDRDALAEEQESLDRHDDIVDDANVRVKRLISICSSSANSSKHKAISRRLSQLEKAVRSVCDSIISLNVRSDVCLIRQCEERLQVHKMNLRELSASISTICLEDSEELYACQNGLEKLILENDLIVKKLLVSGIPSTTNNLMHIESGYPNFKHPLLMGNSLVGYCFGNSLMLPYTAEPPSPTWRS